MSLLPCVEVETGGKINASVIWLHGLGASGHDFEPIVPELGLAGAGVRFVFPHAPAMPVTINGGMVMPAWYDIVEISMDRKVDTANILASARRTGELVEREIDRGVDPARIIVAGFSQGGAVAYHFALTSARPLGGLLALSTYLASHDLIGTPAADRDLPILICHGIYDMVVPEVLGEQAAMRLKALGFRPDYRTYPMQHAVSMEEIRDVSAWFRATLGV